MRRREASGTVVTQLHARRGTCRLASQVGPGAGGEGRIAAAFPRAERNWGWRPPANIRPCICLLLKKVVKQPPQPAPLKLTTFPARRDRQVRSCHFIKEIGVSELQKTHPDTQHPAPLLAPSTTISPTPVTFQLLVTNGQTGSLKKQAAVGPQRILPNKGTIGYVTLCRGRDKFNRRLGRKRCLY